MPNIHEHLVVLRSKNQEMTFYPSELRAVAKTLEKQGIDPSWHKNL